MFTRHVWAFCTCLSSYNTAPMLWNNPSAPPVIHCDLKPDTNKVRGQETPENPNEKLLNPVFVRNNSSSVQQDSTLVLACCIMKALKQIKPLNKASSKFAHGQEKPTALQGDSNNELLVYLLGSCWPWGCHVWYVAPQPPVMKVCGPLSDEKAWSDSKQNICTPTKTWGLLASNTMKLDSLTSQIV